MKLTVNEFNTSPLVLHGNGNGKSTEVYTRVGHYQFSRNVNKIDKDKYTFISWKGGNIAGKKTILEVSGDQYGFDVINLPWAPTDGFWKGSQQKVTETLKAIKNGLIKTEYVFWLDNTDVFFIDSPDIFFEKYKSVYGNYDFVWNAEKNNYPTPSHAKWNGSMISERVTNLLLDVIDTDNTYDSSFRYMNSGAGFGKTSKLLEMLEYAETLIENSRLNDQALMRIAQKKYKDTVVVDRTCELFLCCWGLNTNEVTINL